MLTIEKLLNTAIYWDDMKGNCETQVLSDSEGQIKFFYGSKGADEFIDFLAEISSNNYQEYETFASFEWYFEVEGLGIHVRVCFPDEVY